MTLFAFKDGSDAVIKHSPCLGVVGRLFIGEDVTVHRQLLPSEVPHHFRVHPTGTAAQFYLISPRDGRRSVVCSHCLAPKPDNAHTWAGIEALTGWRPPASTTATTGTGSAPEGGAA